MFTTIPALSREHLDAVATVAGANKFVIYGAGLYGRRIAEILRRFGFMVAAFVDGNEALWGTVVAGAPVLSPIEAGARFGEDAFFLIALARYSMLPEDAVKKDVAALLEKHGCGNIGHIPSLHEMLGRFDCLDHGVDLTQDPLHINGFMSPNFFLSPNAAIRNNFGLVLSETLLPRTDGGDGFYGRPYDMPGMTGLRAGDVVADCGANLGVFSAYAASRGCAVHAFEPIPELAGLMEKTAALYPGKIHIHRAAVGAEEGECAFAVSRLNAAWNVKGDTDSDGHEADSVTVRITSLDRFVAVHNLPALDYIKSDIEGDERNLLRGARGVLRRFAPKLALSSYHLPDDPQAMEAEILRANPDYRVRHLDDKLYAWIEKTS
jgi:methyltransferase, FkbM family